MDAWFSSSVGEPFAFQRECWSAQRAGLSGLLHAPTGMGKTLAALRPTLERGAAGAVKTGGLRLLWITPLRALATDTTQTIAEAVEGCVDAASAGGEASSPLASWRVERRTGDVSQALKNKQKKSLPEILVTTPESLTLLLSYADAYQRFSGLDAVVVDEWHELMSIKRGTQTELALARLRRWANERIAQGRGERRPVTVWGLSATLGNLDEARQALLGGEAERGVMVHGQADKKIEITTVLPPDVQRFPWAGHLGIVLAEPVIEAIEAGTSSLLFTNTRSQAEIWFHRIITSRPDWVGQVALHHGSIDRKTRLAVEELLRTGGLKCVVCTSSLDLGVDFSPVDQVFQVASPKGVARLMQRAGRSGHGPGRVSRVIGVPTHALELIDFAAAREAVEARAIESRQPLDRPLDVLIQHLVTCAAGGGFTRDGLLEEVRQTHAYRHLTEQEFDWVLAFVEHGGDSFKAYPQYARVVQGEDGRYVTASLAAARTHRLGIGTITSDAALKVKYQNGKTLGTVEENFVGFLKPGDKFVFAGHLLQLVRVRQMVVTVKPAKGVKANVPRWQGGRTPLSTELAAAVRRQLDAAREGHFASAELQAIRPLLMLQAQWSILPASTELLIEMVDTRDGHHAFVYPLQGRLVHEGLGALLAQRMTAASARSLVVTVNDYGLELLSTKPLPTSDAQWRAFFGVEQLLEDLLICVNTSQLARRQFRDIARIAGLIVPTYPGQERSQRHLQASSELFFDVLQDFEPDSLLLDQARREVLDRQLEVTRLREGLEQLAGQAITIKSLPGLTPLSFPLWAERLRQQHASSESWTERIQRAAAKLEAAAGEVTGHEANARQGAGAKSRKRRRPVPKKVDP